MTTVVFHTCHGGLLVIRVRTRTRTLYDALLAATEADPRLIFSLIRIRGDLVIRWIKHPAYATLPADRCFWVAAINGKMVTGSIENEPVRDGDWIDFKVIEIEEDPA